MQGTQNNQNNLKKEQSWKTFPYSTTYYNVIVINSVVLALGEIYKSME